MAEIENHFTVFVRLPFYRGDFIDPPPVAWSVAKERALWDVISRQGQGKGNEIDWHALATQFEVTQPFILQQAAWLYERQLSQVRAQLRKVGNRQSATPSPAPGSMSSSMVGGQAMKRAGSGGSRVPSRLSTQQLGSPTAGGSTPPTPAKSRTSLPLRSASGGQSQPRAPGSSRPLSRQSSKEIEYPLSRRGSTQQQLSRSPGQAKAVHIQASDFEDEESQSKMNARRSNPSALHRKSLSLRKEQAQKPKHPTDDDDEPTFLPFAADAADADLSRQMTTSSQDPGATIRGGFNQGPSHRPTVHRRSTSEHVLPSEGKTAATPKPGKQHISSSSDSLSSASNANNRPKALPSTRASRPQNSNALSPRQQAALASVGLSPRRHGSESSPSMGSSFSDLEDASVTQSALEEALLSGMGNTTATMGGGMASRVSGISQALRSRYYDARGQPQGQPRESEK